MLPLSKEYETSLTEIKSMSNELLATGYIHSITPDYIEVSNPDDQMFLIPYETKVKISIFNNKLGFQILAGQVYLSTSSMLRIVDISSLGGMEKRSFFRINLHTEGALLPVTDDTCHTEPQAIAIHIENISLGGIGFSARHLLQVGEKALIDLEVSEIPLSLPCEICRVRQEAEMPYHYGARFYNCTNKQMDTLYQFIFQKEIALLRKRKNYIDAQ